MNIEYTRGCTALSLTADGTEEVDMTDEQRTEVKQKICEWIMKEADLNELLHLLVKHYDEYVEAPNVEYITKTLFKDKKYFKRVSEFFEIKEYPVNLETEIDIVEALN